MLTELVLLFATAFLALRLYFSWKFSYWKRKNVPFIQPSFPWGNIRKTLLLQETIGETFEDLYRKLEHEAVAGIYGFCEPILLLRDPELIKTVLIKEFSTFKTGGFQISRHVDAMMGINPFVLSGDEWKTVRALHGPSHTTVRLKEAVSSMKDSANNFINYMKQHLDKEIEVTSVCGFYAMDCVAIGGYGLNTNSFKQEKGSISEFTQGQVFGTRYSTAIGVLCSVFAHKLGRLLRIRVIPKSTENFFLEMVKEALKHRIKNNSKRKDFMQALVDKSIEKTKSNDGLSVVEMAGHCMTLFIDGYATASTALSFAVYEIANHPEVQDRLREEVLSMGSTLESIDYDKVHSLEYLDMVVSEALRKYTPVQFLSRLCTKDTLLAGKYPVEVGTTVVVPTTALHGDPKYFPNPELFDPERFSRENKESIPSGVYLPFGDGPRICLGKKFAMTEIKVAIAAIVMNFKLWPTRPYEPIALDPAGTLVSAPQGGLYIKMSEMKKTN